MLDVLSYGIELFARVLLVIPFIYSAVVVYQDRPGFIKMMQDKKIPASKLFLYGALALKFGGSFGIVFGFYEAFFAFALAIFTAVATYYFHDFWNYKGEKRMAELIWFSTNLGLIGGLLLLGSMKMPLYL